MLLASLCNPETFEPHFASKAERACDSDQLEGAMLVVELVVVVVLDVLGELIVEDEDGEVVEDEPVEVCAIASPAQPMLSIVARAIVFNISDLSWKVFPKERSARRAGLFR
jgi:hypothetical protein